MERTLALITVFACIWLPTAFFALTSTGGNFPPAVENLGAFAGGMWALILFLGACAQLYHMDEPEEVRAVLVSDATLPVLRVQPFNRYQRNRFFR